MPPNGRHSLFPPADPATTAAASQAPQQGAVEVSSVAGQTVVVAGTLSSGSNAPPVPSLPISSLNEQQQQLGATGHLPHQGMPPPPPRRISTDGNQPSASGGLHGLAPIKVSTVVSPRKQPQLAQRSIQMVAATPRSVFTYATQDLSDDSDGDDDDEGGGNGFGKRKIKRTLTRLQRQQRIIAAQNAALLQHQQLLSAQGTPYDTPQGSPRASDAAAAVPAQTSPPQPSHGSSQAGDAVLQGNSRAAAYGGKDVGVFPGVEMGGKGAQSAFATAALAAAAAVAARSAAGRDTSKPQAELGDDLAVLQELMGDSVQGADLHKRMPWFDGAEARLYTAGFMVALLVSPLIIGGLIAASISKVDPVQIYRLLMYFAGWPFIWIVVNVCIWLVVIFMERRYYKQALCYHGKLRRTLTFLVWTCLLLAWFHACAWVPPCGDRHVKCRYNLVHNTSKPGQTVWRFSLCLCLFSLALFITSLLGRLLNRHFYNTAHFTKVANVLWKQYWLVMLSQPRSKLMGKEQLLRDSSHGSSSSRAEAILRQRKGYGDDTIKPNKHGWSTSHLLPKVLKQSDEQLLPTHTTAGGVEGCRLPNGTAPAAAAASGVGRHSHKQQHVEHLALVEEGSEAGSGYGKGGSAEPSFRSVSLSAGMGPDVKLPDQHKVSRLRQKLQHRRQKQPGYPTPNPEAAVNGGSWFANWRSGWKVGGSNPDLNKPQYDFGDEASKALQHAGAVRALVDGSQEVPNDPLLDAGVLKALNVKLDNKPLDAAKFSANEWPRIREGIAIQTYEVLMERYRGSKEEEEQQLRSARRLGKALFQHVKGDAQRTHIMREDFDIFFAGLPNAEAEADAAFFFFDKENNAMIAQHEMVNKVVEIVQERQDMASSLRDTNSIVSTLEAGIGLAINVLFLLLYLAVWKIDVAKGFTTVTAALMFFSFMFSNSAKNVFEATLFLLVAHAFDVGDMLGIDGTMYRVSKISLLYTTLLKNSGEISLYPNAKLLAAPLINLSRGNCLQTDKVVIQVDTGDAGNTTFDALTAAMQEHFEGNERHFNSVPLVRFTGIVNPFKAELTISWTYNFGPSQPGRAKKVKSALLCTVQNTLGQLPEMLSADQPRVASSAALQGLASNAHGNEEHERMMMNAAVMGTLAATDLNVNETAGDSFFMA